MTITDKERTPLFWSIAAAFLLLVPAILASLVQGYLANRDSEKLTIFEGLISSQALATLAQAKGTPEQYASLFERLQAQDPSLIRAFVMAEAGADELGLVQDSDRRFLFDSLTRQNRLRPDDAPLGTACGEISATFDSAHKPKADSRAKAAWPPSVGQLFRPTRGSDGTPLAVSMAPIVVKSEGAAEGSLRLIGVAGVVRTVAPPLRQPYMLHGLLFLALALIVYIGAMLLSGRAQLAFIPAAVVLTACYAWYQHNDSLSRHLIQGQQRAQSVLVSHDALHTVAPDVPFDTTVAWQRAYDSAPAPVARFAGTPPASFADQHAQGISPLVAASGGFLMAFDAGQFDSRSWSDTSSTLLVLIFVLIAAGFVVKPTADLFAGLRHLPGVYAYVVPVMVAMILVVFIPFVWGVIVAFFDMNGDFVGLSNFGDILIPNAESSTNFYFTLGVTMMWTITNVVLHVVIGLILALILNNPRLQIKGLYRVLLVVPWAVPSYITALVWRTMFVPQYGAINNFLANLGLMDASYNWFGSFWSSFGANLLTNVWLGFPFMMVVSLGALQSIPADLYEAADIDGASRWQKFRRITLPLLKPALFPAVILGTIWTFNQFNVIFLVSHGLPANQTNILITEAYRFFRELHQNGIAAAYCLMIFAVLLLYTLITNRITRATEGAFD